MTRCAWANGLFTGRMRDLRDSFAGDPTRWRAACGLKVDPTSGSGCAYPVDGEIVWRSIDQGRSIGALIWSSTSRPLAEHRGCPGKQVRMGSDRLTPFPAPNKNRATELGRFGLAKILSRGHLIRIAAGRCAP